MSEQERNAAILREAFGRWGQSKGAGPSMWRDYVTDEFRLWSIADGGHNLQFTAQRTGLDEFENYLAGLSENLQMSDWQILDTIVEGDRVAGLGQMACSNRKTGRRSHPPSPSSCASVTAASASTWSISIRRPLQRPSTARDPRPRHSAGRRTTGRRAKPCAHPEVPSFADPHATNMPA